LEEQLAFQRTTAFWERRDGQLVPCANPLQLVHRSPGTSHTLRALRRERESMSKLLVNFSNNWLRALQRSVIADTGK